MSRNMLRLIGAAMIAAIGMALAWRALGPGVLLKRSPSSSLNEGASETTRVKSNGPPRLTPADFETQVTPENVIEIADGISNRVAALLGEAPAASNLSQTARKALVEEARAQMQIYLSGSFERYMDYTKHRAASMPALEAYDPAEREEKLKKLKRFWESTASPVAFRPVSLDDVRVLPRYIQGQEITQPQFLCRQKNVSRTRYELTNAPQRSKGDQKFNASIPVRYDMTIYELIVPVYQKQTLRNYKQESPGYLGIWLAWDQGTEQWMIWQICGYGWGAVLPVY